MRENLPTQKRALLLFYSFTGQSELLVRSAGEELAARGWEVTPARIEFTDSRYAPRLASFPLKKVWPTMLSFVPAQARGVKGKIAVGEEAFDGPYDLVCIGSPTWWGRASIPIRSFLAAKEGRRVLAGRPFAVFVSCRDSWEGNLKEVRKLGEWQGGRYVGEMHATAPGNAVESVLSLTSYLGSGEYRDRFLGVRIPPTNVQPEHVNAARSVAATIADADPTADGGN